MKKLFAKADGSGTIEIERSDVVLASFFRIIADNRSQDTTLLYLRDGRQVTIAGTPALLCTEHYNCVE